MTTLLDVQGIKANSVFAILAIVQRDCKIGIKPTAITFGVGTKRTILARYGSDVFKNSADPVGLVGTNGKVINGESFLQLLVNSCDNAISVEDFLAQNNSNGLNCCLVNDPESNNTTVTIGDELERWIKAIPEDQTRFARCVGIGIEGIFARGNCHDQEAPLYVVRSGRSYYTISGRYSGFSQYYNILSAARLTYKEACDIAASNPGAKVIGPKPIAYAIKLKGPYHPGEYVESVSKRGFYNIRSPKDAKAYTTRAAALKAAKLLPSGHDPVIVKFTFNDDGSDCIEEA